MTELSLIPSNCSHLEKQNTFPAQGNILNSSTNIHKNRKKQTENKTVTPFASLCVLHAVISPKSPSEFNDKKTQQNQ